MATGSEFIDRIYNPVYEQKKEEAQEKQNEKLLGLKRVDEDSIFRYSNGRESFFVELESLDQIEEDLTKIGEVVDKSDPVKAAAERAKKVVEDNKISLEALEDIYKMLGSFIDLD